MNEIFPSVTKTPNKQTNNPKTINECLITDNSFKFRHKIDSHVCLDYLNSEKDIIKSCLGRYRFMHG